MLKQPIKIYVSRASKEAIQAIEGTGGKITTVYYNRLGIQCLVNPDRFGITKRKPRPAMPVKRYLIGICFLWSRSYAIRLLQRSNEERVLVIANR
jgi:hypothetical protein